MRAIGDERYEEVGRLAVEIAGILQDARPLMYARRLPAWHRAVRPADRLRDRQARLVEQILRDQGRWYEPDEGAPAGQDELF